jgi:hypothetical protein
MVRRAVPVFHEGFDAARLSVHEFALGHHAVGSTTRARRGFATLPMRPSPRSSTRRRIVLLRSRGHHGPGGSQCSTDARRRSTGGKGRKKGAHRHGRTPMWPRNYLTR